MILDYYIMCHVSGTHAHQEIRTTLRIMNVQTLNLITKTEKTQFYIVLHVLMSNLSGFVKSLGKVWGGNISIQDATSILCTHTIRDDAHTK